jgi:hypothetical protein
MKLGSSDNLATNRDTVYMTHTVYCGQSKATTLLLLLKAKEVVYQSPNSE